MSEIKELKSFFTTVTGLPATKRFAVAVCQDIGIRRMMSTTDWRFAVENIQPQFRLMKDSDELRKADAEYEQSLLEEITWLGESRQDIAINLENCLEYEAGLMSEITSASSDELLAQISSLKEKNEQLEEELNEIVCELESSLDEKESDIYELQASVDSLEEQLKEKKEAIAEAKEREELLKVKIKELEKEFGTAHERLEFSLHLQSVRVSTLVSENQELQKENESLKTRTAPDQKQDSSDKTITLMPFIKIFDGEAISHEELMALALYLNSTCVTDNFLKTLLYEWLILSPSVAKTNYKNFSRLVHPDMHIGTGQAEQFAEIFKTLNTARDYFELALEKQEESNEYYQNAARRYDEDPTAPSYGNGFATEEELWEAAQGF